MKSLKIIRDYLTVNKIIKQEVILTHRFFLNYTILRDDLFF